MMMFPSFDELYEEPFSPSPSVYIMDQERSLSGFKATQIKSESPNDYGSDFYYGGDSSPEGQQTHSVWNYFESMPIKREKSPHVKEVSVKREPPQCCATSSDPLEQMRKLCLQQAVNDVKRACHNLGISPYPQEWAPMDVQKWLYWLAGERRIESCFSSLDFLMKMSGAHLVAFCENDQRWLHHQTVESIQILLVDKIAANLDIWKSAAQHIAALDALNCESDRVPSHLNDFGWSPANPSGCGMRCPNHPDRPSSTGLGDESDEDSMPRRKVTTSGRQHTQLWQFLRDLLANPKHSNCIRWIDRKRRIFKIVDSVQVAKLWGSKKNRPAMNYDKMSRSIRQYYRKGIMKKTERSQRLVYQFCAPYDN